jgi:hypothetical protein
MSIKAVIYPKDLVKITGKSQQTCQRELNKIKQALSLKKHEYLSLSAYCQYTKISMEDAKTALNCKNTA